MTQNVFEFLGLPADHRAKDKVVQLVKHFDEVPDSKKSWPMIGQIKKDGVFALVVVRCLGSVGIFSRTGKRYTNLSNLGFSLMSKGLPAGVYLAELCNDSVSLETLSGLVNPNRVKELSEEQEIDMEDTYLAFHDFLYTESFISGKSVLYYPVRYSLLEGRLPKGSVILDYYYLEGPATLDQFLKEQIAAGEEGVCIKQLDEGWVAGHKGYRVMKKVRGVDYDLECVGVEEGTGKYKGKVANLLFSWKNGKTIKAMLGKGWTHDDVADMWSCHNYGKMVGTPEYRHINSPIGKIFQVYALQESSKGKLRLPKVGELRHDKTKADV